MMMWIVEAPWWNNETKVYSWTIGRLTEVPSDIPAQAVEVYLTYTPIEVIRQNSFSHLNACETLRLHHNEIHTIESGAWNGLSSLRVLHLYDNELEVLRPGMWSGLNNCTKLKLEYNKIHTIQSGTFQDGLSSLQTLDLGGNEIKEITQGTFLGLTQCTLLNLYDNKIHTIHSGGFDGLDSLTMLSLFSNKIHTIQNGGLKGLDSLTSLDLQNNQLTTLQWTVFGKERPLKLNLFMYSSSMVCNSSLCWVKLGIQDGWPKLWGGPCSSTLSCTHLGLYGFLTLNSNPNPDYNFKWSIPFETNGQPSYCVATKDANHGLLFPISS